MSTSKQSQPSDPNKNINEFNKFLQNNHQFLLQRYSQHFGQQAFTFTQLQTKIKIQLAIKFIYDVFSFQKYEKDQKMNNTLKRSLKDNIISFIKKQLAQNNNNNQQKKVFKSEVGIKLLKFCIQHNQMFAVHYDKKQKEKTIKKQQLIQNKQEQIKQDQKQDQKQQENQNKQEQAIQQKQQQQLNPKQQSPIINKKQLHQIKQEKPQQITQKINTPKKQSLQNQLQQQTKHNQILKKQAKIVFDFYCKQLNSSGPTSTFDKIYYQSGVMTLGKFIAFANITGILYNVRVKSFIPKDHKVLDKKTINQIWRIISKSQKQVNFDQFFQILKQLNNIDPTVYDKLNMGKEQTTNKILRKLKYLNTPFNMKGQYAKQTDVVIDQKPYMAVPTSHSGKFTHSIQQDMIERKQKLRYLPFKHDRNYNQIKINSQQHSQNNLNTSIIRSSVKLQQILPQYHRNTSNSSNFISQIGNPQKKNKTSHIQQSNKPKNSNKIRLQNSRISIQGDKQFQNHDLLRNLIVIDNDINDDQFLKDYKIPQLTSHNNIKKKQYINLNNIKQISNQRKQRFSGMKNRKNIINQYKQRVRQVQKSQNKQENTRDNKKRSIHSLYSKN